LVEGFGFRLDRVTGSHYIFVHPDIPELVNLQEVKGEAKPLSNPPVSSTGGAAQSTLRGGHMKDYHINIFYSDEDGGHIADIPDLEACSAFGDTAEKALAEVKIAKDAWLKTARKAGKPIPKPRYRPVIYQVGH